VKSKFIQTTVPVSTYKKLEARAAEEGLSIADIIRRAVTDSLAARPLAERVEALQAALIAFGIVPDDGVRQPNKRDLSRAARRGRTDSCTTTPCPLCTSDDVLHG
jgi:hypothetical protein